MKFKERTITCLWLFPLMFFVIILGFSRIFFPVIFILMAYEIIIRLRRPIKPINFLAILHICGILFVIFLEKGEVFFLLAVIFSNDCAAMFSGRLLGSKFFSEKPVPKISPNKTFEGYIGGFAGALITGIIIGEILGYEMPEILTITLFLTVCGNAGDLLNSFFKRSCGVKDSGEELITDRIFAGHGGAYDRFDSISFTVPFWLLWSIL